MSSKKNPMAFVQNLQSTPALSRVQRLAESSNSKSPEERTQASKANGQPSAEPGYLQYEQAEVYEPGQRVLIPEDLVGDHPLNPRAFFSETALQELVKSIAKTGLQTAVQVYPRNEEGKYVLKSGHRRTRALRLLGHKFIKAEVVAPTGDTLRDYREAREINREHKSHTHIDDAVRFKQLLEEGLVKEQKQLADMLGINQVEVSRHLSIASLPPEALEKMAEYPTQCSFTASYLLYRYWAETKQDNEALQKLIKRVIDGKVSTRQLEQVIASLKDNPSPEKKREHALSRAEFGGFAKGELKAFEGKLTLQLESIPADKRDELFRALIELFQGQGLTVGGATKAKPVATEPA